MLIPFRWLFGTQVVTPTEEERDGGRKTRRKWPKALRTHITWSDDVVMPSRAELAQRALKIQIDEEDEILALLASML